MNQVVLLPETGFVRLPTVLLIFPVSRSAWWQGVRDGRYPPGFKLSPRCTAWRAEDIRALIERKQADSRKGDPTPLASALGRATKPMKRIAEELQ